MQLTPEEFSAFRDMARSFARRSVAPMLDHESPDGDLERTRSILDEAMATGVMASADPESPGHETGAWGRQAIENGPRSSLMLLSELASVCAGVAMNVHAAGLAALVLNMADKAPARVPARAAVALFEGGYLPGPSAIVNPSGAAPPIAARARGEKGGYVLSGGKDYVFAPFGLEAFLVFALEADDWACFVVPREAPGLEEADSGIRMGLRACPCLNLKFKDLVLPAESRLSFSTKTAHLVLEYMRLNWLGMVAMSHGMARGALERAREYAEERYQGCCLIINHPAMGMLLSDASSRLLVLESLMEKASLEEGTAWRKFILAAEAKLAGLRAAADAVTDSLQVFGGYGYMEDYRMEKRYRDVNSLKCAGGSPRDLRAIIAETIGEK